MDWPKMVSADGQCAQNTADAKTTRFGAGNGVEANDVLRFAAVFPSRQLFYSKNSCAVLISRQSCIATAWCQPMVPASRCSSARSA